MSTVLISFVKNLWPFSLRKLDDLKLSDRLVSRLSIPETTKQFVFAIPEPESQSVVYILVTQNLSERSALDADVLIRELRPDVVVTQVAASALQEIQEEEKYGFNGNTDTSSLVPTSALGVLKGCFLEKFNKESYENVAGSVVLREIFGVGFHGHLLAVKKAAKEVGSLLLLLESPFVSTCADELEMNNDNGVGKSNFQALGGSLRSNNLLPQKMGSVVPLISRRIHLDSDIHKQMLKCLGSSIKPKSSGSVLEVAVEDCLPMCGYEVPSFAQSIYPLLNDLHNIFNDLPSIGRALAYAQKMLRKVDKGEEVDCKLLSEVQIFRIAVEGLRIGLNNLGRLPIEKLKGSVSSKCEFSDLPTEEKCHALFAHTIRSQTKKFKSIVAIVDAKSLSGLRKHWDTPLPPDVKDLIDRLVIEYDNKGDSMVAENADKKSLITSKPVVAVGASATAVLGVSSFSKIVPASTFVKLLTINVPTFLKLSLAQTQKALAIALGKMLGSSKVLAPGVVSSGAKSTSVMKAAASAEKIRAVAHSVIASAERTSFSAMRTSFYEIMRRRRFRPVGCMQWTTFGCSIATCAGLILYGDGIECAAESVPAAPTVASLGRGLQSLHQASQEVRQTDRSKLQEAIQSFMYSLKKVKVQ